MHILIAFSLSEKMYFLALYTENTSGNNHIVTMIILELRQMHLSLIFHEKKPRPFREMTDWKSGQELYKMSLGHLVSQIKESYPSILWSCQNYTAANLKGSHCSRMGQKNNDHNTVKHFMILKVKSKKA